MPERYSRTAIALHWAIAGAILFQIAVGRELDALGRRGFDLFQLHKSIGITILLLSLIRLAVRLTKPRPPAAEPGVTGMLAGAVHAGFYIVMIGAPLTGWLLVSTSRVKVPTLLFGIVPLPHLPAGQGLNGLADSGHETLAWLAIGLLLLHLAGAARHHLLLRDGLLWRMSPARSWLILLPLIALVPGGFLLGRTLVVQMAKPSPVAPRPAAAATSTPPPPAEAPVPRPDPTPVEASPTTSDEITTPPSWTIAPGGRLGFSVGGADGVISGSFARWSGKIVMDPDRPDGARASCV